eukprot:1922596-Pyramimonas_sp.AAC.3
MAAGGSQSRHRGGNVPGGGANHVTGEGICREGEPITSRVVPDHSPTLRQRVVTLPSRSQLDDCIYLKATLTSLNSVRSFTCNKTVLRTYTYTYAHHSPNSKLHLLYKLNLSLRFLCIMTSYLDVLLSPAPSDEETITEYDNLEASDKRGEVYERPPEARAGR